MEVQYFDLHDPLHEDVSYGAIVLCPFPQDHLVQIECVAFQDHDVLVQIAHVHVLVQIVYVPVLVQIAYVRVLVQIAYVRVLVQIAYVHVLVQIVDFGYDPGQVAGGYHVPLHVALAFDHDYPADFHALVHSAGSHALYHAAGAHHRYQRDTLPPSPTRSGARPA